MGTTQTRVSSPVSSPTPPPPRALQRSISEPYATTVPPPPSSQRPSAPNSMSSRQGLQRSVSQPDGPAAGATHAALLRSVSQIDGPSASPIPSSSSSLLGLAPDKTSRESRKRYLDSLELSLKQFLRASNLPGLEYRLRLAGFYSVSDLVEARESDLVASGFTMIMARRLLTALVEYLRRHFDRTGGPTLPFQLVRPGQKITSEPSEKMKAIPTFGKRNVKRSKPQTDKRPHPIPAATVSSLGRSAGRKSAAVIRLMDQESLGTHHFAPPLLLPVQKEEEEEEMEEAGGGNREDTDLNRVYLGGRNQPLSVSREPLRRTMSVPADYRYRWSSTDLDIHTHVRVRHYSCPPSLVFMAMDMFSMATMASLVGTLFSSDDVETVCAVVQVMAVKCRREDERREAVRVGGVEAVAVALEKHCEASDLAESCCRLLRLLTRTGVVCSSVPAEAVSVVLLAMNCHPSHLSLQTQGCLAISNLERQAPSQCRQVLFDGGIPTIAAAMQSFEDQPPLLVSALAAISVALSSVFEGRLYLISEHGYLLDCTLSAIERLSSHAQLVEYAIAFLAMLFNEVCVQVESGVVQLVVEQVLVAMATHARDSHVTTWGCKVLAHSAANTALADWKLSEKCCELLADALRTFPESPPVQTWAAYALLQFSSLHRVRVVEFLRHSSLPSPTPHPSHTLSDEAHSYLAQLHELL